MAISFKVGRLETPWGTTMVAHSAPDINTAEGIVILDSR